MGGGEVRRERKREGEAESMWERERDRERKEEGWRSRQSEWRERVRRRPCVPLPHVRKGQGRAGRARPCGGNWCFHHAAR